MDFTTSDSNKENMKFAGASVLFDGRLIVNRGYGGLPAVTFSRSSVSAGRRPKILPDPNGVSWNLSDPPQPGGGFTRLTEIHLGGSKRCTFPSSGTNFIFVQGKNAVCAASCDMDKDQDRTKTMNDLMMCIACLPDFKLYTARMYKQPVELEPSAAVSVSFDSDEEKGSTPSSGHKVFGEEAAISILKKGLESRSTETLSGTLLVAICALQSFYHMKRLHADEIEVYVAGVDGSRSLLTREEIAGYLDRIQCA